LTFDIVGGDDRLRDYRIEVVDNPTVANMTLYCVYPEYMRRAPRTLPVTGLMQIPVGTKITIRATANKPLARAQIERVVEQGVQPLSLVTEFSGGQAREFRLDLAPLAEDMRLQFRLHDTDGIEGRNPVRLDLAAVADEAPKVGLQLRGIGTAITTQARLPVAGEIVDDYGLERVWFEYQADDADPRRAAFLASAGGKNTLAIDAERPEVLDLKELQEVADLTIKEDQRLSLVVRAEDQSTLEGGPFIGAGEKYQLDVVSPDRLLAML
jgi:hypothetical protein